MTGLETMSGVFDRLRLRRLRTGAVKSTPGLSASPLVAGDALSRLTCSRTAAPGVVLVVPTMKTEAVFAGLRTALEAAGRIVQTTGLPLRVRTLDAGSHGANRRSSRSIAAMLDLPPSRVDVGSAWSERRCSPDDVWVVTYFSTALAVERACRAGMVDRDRVIYLVQDHEPAFFPASVESAIAAATYRAGFRLLINSEPLRRFLAEHTDARGLSEARTFRPSVDIPALQRAAANRRQGDTVRIGFYARPGKPRNAFEIGRAALQEAGERLAASGLRTSVHTMGAPHEPFTVAGRSVDVLGRLPWDTSFDVLSRTDVLLSLQLTPHPSHPPLDAVISGGIAVTNEVGGSRAGLHSRLVAVEASPSALADAVYETVGTAASRCPSAFDADFVTSLGRPLIDAVDDASEGL